MVVEGVEAQVEKGPFCMGGGGYQTCRLDCSWLVTHSSPFCCFPFPAWPYRGREADRYARDRFLYSWPFLFMFWFVSDTIRSIWIFFSPSLPAQMNGTGPPLSPLWIKKNIARRRIGPTNKGKVSQRRRTAPWAPAPFFFPSFCHRRRRLSSYPLCAKNRSLFVFLVSILDSVAGIIRRSKRRSGNDRGNAPVIVNSWPQFVYWTTRLVVTSCTTGAICFGIPSRFLSLFSSILAAVCNELICCCTRPAELTSKQQICPPPSKRFSSFRVHRGRSQPSDATVAWQFSPLNDPYPESIGEVSISLPSAPTHWPV